MADFLHPAAGNLVPHLGMEADLAAGKVLRPEIAAYLAEGKILRQEIAAAGNTLPPGFVADQADCLRHQMETYNIAASNLACSSPHVMSSL